MIKKLIRKVIGAFNHRLDEVLYRVWCIIENRKELNDIIIMSSHNDFDTNSGALYDYLINNGYLGKYKIVWLLWNRLDRTLPLNVEAYYINKASIKKNYYLATAKIITSDAYVSDKKREGQKVYYLTHGSVSLKNVGTVLTLPDSVDYYLTSSDFVAPIHAKIYGFPINNSKQLITGYPIHDCLYRQSTNEIKKITQKEYKKKVLWMPTFRKLKGSSRNDSRHTYPLGIPIFSSIDEVRCLNEFLSNENILLIIKLHPYQDVNEVYIKESENIKIVDLEKQKSINLDIYELMKDVDACISDYSSVASDFLQLNKPIAYAVDDIEDYKLGFIVDDVKELMGGMIVTNYEELLLFLKDIVCDRDLYMVKRNEVLHKLFKYTDGNSCKRLVEHMGL